MERQKTNRWIDGETKKGKLTDGGIENKQMNRRKDRKLDRWRDRKLDRQMERQKANR